MERQELIRALRELTDKQFVELFYESADGRHIYELEREHVDAHLVLANAARYREDGSGWSTWRLQLVCLTPGQEWVDDAPVCQFGEHCGLETASWSKNSQCPVCGGKVYGT